MQIEKLDPIWQGYLTKHNLEKKFQKQISLLEINPSHPSLHREKLIPKELGLFSFRLDRKFRVTFIVKPDNIIEILRISNHYSD